MPSPEPEAEPDGRTEEGVFAGIRVVEIGQYVAAPIAAELLAHGGADVVKIERVSGDVTRYTDPLPEVGDTGAADGRQYVIKARGKRALPVDLSRPEGRALVAELAVRSDVLITNLRPGTADRLGLGYETLEADNPRLVYGEINGFGQGGPLAGRPSLDLIAQSWTGLRLATGTGDDGELGRYEPFFCDYIAGLLLAFGVAGALHRRNLTGRGDRVSTSLADTGLFAQHRTANLFDSVDGWKRDVAAMRADGASLAEAHQARVAGLTPDVFFMSTYETADGAVSLGAAGLMSARLCELFEVDNPFTQPEWADRSRRKAALAETRARLALAIAPRTTDEVIALLDDAGIPVGPVRLLEETLVDPDARSAGLVYEHDHPRLGRYILPSAPVTFDGADYRARHELAFYGEHTDDLLRELGYDQAAIEQMAADGIVHRTADAADG